jgi:hypothetical protein
MIFIILLKIVNMDGSVILFIWSVFIRSIFLQFNFYYGQNLYSRILYGQNLYSSKFIQVTNLYRSKFIQLKMYTVQNLYGQFIYRSNFIQAPKHPLLRSMHYGEKTILLGGKWRPFGLHFGLKGTVSQKIWRDEGKGP